MLPVESNKTGKFERLISLGGFCQVAYQIEQRFGFRINSPFDWVVTPLESISRILSDDGDQFGKIIKVLFDGQTAICGHYGIAYQHDFPRDEEHRIIVSADALADCRSKMLHKYNRFRNLLRSGRTTLFVRMGGHHDTAFPSPYVSDSRPTTTADLNALCAILSQKFPSLPFALAFVFLREVTSLSVDPSQLDSRVKLFELLNDTGASWTGEAHSWAPIFDSYDLGLASDEGKARQFFDPIEYECLHA